MPASVPRGTVCAVRYQLKRDSGTDYEALLTVATTDDVAGHLWRVKFAYPGSQRLTRLEKAVAQKGHRVVVKGRGKLRAFTLRGDAPSAGDLALGIVLFGAGLVAMYSLWILCAAAGFWVVRLGLRPLDRIGATAGPSPPNRPC